MNSESMIEVHDITAFTGQALQEHLENLVDNKWISNTEHRFAINDTIRFTITVETTISQPGRGIVKFPNSTIEWPSWDNFAPVVSNISFPANRMMFINETLETIPFDEYFDANVLMLFEIARREEVVNPNTIYPYPLLREQTKQAIDMVMNASAEEYLLQIEDLIQMFSARNIMNHQPAHPKRLAAYQRIVERNNGN